jgi:hypothetical protein
MAKSKEPTREEKAVKTLEDAFNLGLTGSNFLKRVPNAFGNSGYGAGVSTYAESMESENAQNIRETLYDNKKREAQLLGIAETPSRPTDYETMRYVAGIVQENQMIIPLGALEEVVAKVAGPLGFNVPEEWKTLTFAEINQEIGEKLAAGEELSEELKDKNQMFSALRQAYEMGAGKGIFDKHYLATVSALGKEITDKYAPEEDSK